MVKCGQCKEKFNADGTDGAIVFNEDGVAQDWCEDCWENFANKCNSCKVWYTYTLDACPECGDTECEGGRF